MENQSTFQAHLESILKAAGEPANPNQRLIENAARHYGTLGSVNHGIASVAATFADKRNQAVMGEESEDFIIGPLSKETRLHSPVDLVQVARDFYSGRGLSPSRHTITLPDFEEVIAFGNPKTGGYVQFDLGRGFRKDGNYELWVTSDFWNLKEK